MSDADGDPALIFAIQSKCLTTINLLAPKTQKKLGGAMRCLAREKIELMTGELRQLVERAAQDREAAIRGLEGAARFGSSVMVEMIARHTTDHSIFEERKQSLWMEAVESDSEAKVTALLPNLPLEEINHHPGKGERGVCGG